MQQQRPPWDARVIEWMQRSARHTGQRAPRPIRGRELLGTGTALVALGAVWATTGVDTWPVIVGVGAALVVRL